MDYIHQPYIGYIRDAAGIVYRVAWAETNPNASVFRHPTPFRSNRYYPDGELAQIEIGALQTDQLEWSPYAQSGVPERVCGSCKYGDNEWWETGEFPSDAPPVVLAADGFGVNCEDNLMGVQSVGLAESDIYVVSGSPVVFRGTLSLDLKTQPAGTVFAGPVSGPPAKPSFVPISSLGSGQFVSRLSTGPLAATVLTVTIPGTVSSGDSQVFFSNPDDYRKVGVAMGLASNGGYSSGAITTRVNASANSVETDTPATANFSGDFIFTPNGYEWFEQAFDPDTGEPSDKVGGRSGTITTAPAVELNGAYATIDKQVFMSFRETTTTLIDIYQFEFNPIQPAEEGGGNSLDVKTITNDTITSSTANSVTTNSAQINVVSIGVAASIQFTPQTTPSAFVNSMWVDINGLLQYNDSTGHPSPVSIGSTWVRYEVDFSAAIYFAGIPGVFSAGWIVKLGAIGGGLGILRVSSKCRIAWNPIFASLIFVVSPTESFAVTQFPVAIAPTSVGIGTNLVSVYGGTKPGLTPFYESDGTFELWVYLGGALGFPQLSGHTTLWVEYGSFP